MEQERIFYHGSIIGGLDTILANSKSHTDGSRVAYFTEDRVYALVCCRSREENLVTMGPRDGVKHYFEPSGFIRHPGAHPGPYLGKP